MKQGIPQEFRVTELRPRHRGWTVWRLAPSGVRATQEPGPRETRLPDAVHELPRQSSGDEAEVPDWGEPLFLDATPTADPPLGPPLGPPPAGNWSAPWEDIPSIQDPLFGTDFATLLEADVRHDAYGDGDACDSPGAESENAPPPPHQAAMPSPSGDSQATGTAQDTPSEDTEGLAAAQYPCYSS